MPVTPSFVLIALVTQYVFRIVFKLWKIIVVRLCW